MNESDWRPRVAKFVWPLQIIVAALAAGSLAFLIVVLVVAGSGLGDAGHQDPWMITWVALAFLTVAIVARTVVPSAIVRQGRKKIAQGTFQLPQARQTSQQPSLDILAQMGDPGKLLVLYQIKTIVGGALLEGVAFFLLIAYMIERQTAALGLAAALIVAIALHMPTRSGVVQWIEDQLRLVDEERAMGR